MERETVVVSIGGSILIPGKDDSAFIGDLAAMLRRVLSRVDVAVVCGGGRIARYYTETGRELGGGEYDLDMLGIGCTRLNAGLLALALGDVSSKDIPLTVEQAAAAHAPGRIVVMGGTEPGHTTDAVATMLARELGADRVVNATSVDAVYSEDPRSNPDAERYSRIGIGRLEELVYTDHGAGKSSVFDPLGVKIAKERGIDIMMVDGRNLEELEKAIAGDAFDGTFVDSHRSSRPDGIDMGSGPLSITVFMGSADPIDPSISEAALELGRWIGSRGHTLVYGGSRSGLMGIVAEGAVSAGGSVVGVEPGFFIDREPQFEGLSELIITDDLPERKTIMMERGDAFIAFPGGTGTLEEISEVISRISLDLLDAPCIVYNLDGYFEGLRIQLEKMVSKGLFRAEKMALVRFVDDIRGIEDAIGALSGRDPRDRRS